MLRWRKRNTYPIIICKSTNVFTHVFLVIVLNRTMKAKPLCITPLCVTEKPSPSFWWSRKLTQPLKMMKETPHSISVNQTGLGFEIPQSKQTKQILTTKMPHLAESISNSAMYMMKWLRKKLFFASTILSSLPYRSNSKWLGCFKVLSLNFFFFHFKNLLFLQAYEVYYIS